MSTFLLLSLRLVNFKGARDYTLVVEGCNADVIAKNGVGKSTLADAYYWLLFGKDSRDQSEASFDLKTLGPDNKPIPMIDHSVEGTFLRDGRMVRLKRVYKEVYKRTRGTSEKVFDKNTTDYFVDDVPYQKKDYDAFVASICAEGTFRLLTHPGLFYDDDAFPWKERRKVLVAMCGDVTDADVIASKHALAPLAELLEGRSVDAFRLMIANRRSLIDKEREKIPERIDEANGLLPAESSHAEDLALLRGELAGLQQTREQIKAGGGAIEKENEILRLVGQQNAIATNLASVGGSAREQALRLVGRKDAEISEAQTRKRNIEARIGAAEQDKANVESRREQCRQRCYAEEERRKQRDAQVFDASAETCRTCGQELPEEQRAAARAKFNADKAADLAAIKSLFDGYRADGIAQKNRSEAIGAEIEGFRAQLAGADDEIRRLLQERSGIVVPESTPVDPTEDADYRRIAEEIAGLREEIAAIQADASTALSGIDEEVAQVQTRIQAAESVEASGRHRKEILARIEELKAQEKRLAIQLDEMQTQLDLCDEFTRTKVSKLTDRINERFVYARWRLFKDQQNGGLQECCDVMGAGDTADSPHVPFNSLNTGKRVNVGLDVIDALSDHFEFAPPIFIDCAESVTDILPTRGQQIRLVAKKGVETLEVVTHGKPVAAEIQKETLFA